MSVLPLFVSLNDDLFDPWDTFGLGIHPHEFLNAPQLQRNQIPGSGYYRRHWCLPEQQRGSDNKGIPKPQTGKDGFQVCLDVKQFAPNEISVKTLDNAVVVEGKHEEKQDDHGYISRHFVRRYVLPKEYDAKDIVSTLSSDGVLTVKAPPLAKAIENNERVVQIQQTGPARLSVKENAKEADQEMKESQ